MREGLILTDVGKRFKSVVLWNFLLIKIK
jgi:hypothetical protein